MPKSGILSKLRLKDNLKILIINAPEEYISQIENLKFDIQSVEKNEYYDFIQIFATSNAGLNQLLKNYAKRGKYDCIFWACYPKGGGKIKSDIKRDTVWNAFESVGLRPVTQIAIDETWSALRGRPFDAVGK